MNSRFLARVTGKRVAVDCHGKDGEDLRAGFGWVQCEKPLVPLSGDDE